MHTIGERAGYLGDEEKGAPLSSTRRDLSPLN